MRRHPSPSTHTLWTHGAQPLKNLSSVARPRQCFHAASLPHDRSRDAHSGPRQLTSRGVVRRRPGGTQPAHRGGSPPLAREAPERRNRSASRRTAGCRRESGPRRSPCRRRASARRILFRARRRRKGAWAALQRVRLPLVAWPGACGVQYGRLGGRDEHPKTSVGRAI